MRAKLGQYRHQLKHEPADLRVVLHRVERVVDLCELPVQLLGLGLQGLPGQCSQGGAGAGVERWGWRRGGLLVPVLPVTRLDSPHGIRYTSPLGARDSFR